MKTNQGVRVGPWVGAVALAFGCLAAWGSPAGASDQAVKAAAKNTASKARTAGRAAAESTPGPTFTRVPLLLEEKGPPGLYVRVGGAELALSVDLRSTDALVLGPEALERIPVRRLESTLHAGDGEDFVVPELRIGELVFRNVIGREDAAHTGSWSGRIGAPLLRNHRVLIDYRDRALELYTRSHAGALPSGCDSTAAVPFLAELKTLPITYAETDFGRLTLLWDPAAPATLLRKDVARAFGIRLDSGTVRTEQLRIGEADFGPLAMRLAGEPREADVLVGAEFFASHTVCIDLPGRRFLVAK